jgi:hypothetical protein
MKSRNSSVGIATGYRLGVLGVEVPVPIMSRVFISPCRPDQFWDPLIPLSKVYVVRSGRGKKLTAHLQPVPISRKRGSIIHSSKGLHVVVLNCIRPGRSFHCIYLIFWQTFCQCYYSNKTLWWRMSSGVLHRVVLVSRSVSENILLPS